MRNLLFAKLAVFTLAAVVASTAYAEWRVGVCGITVLGSFSNTITCKFINVAPPGFPPDFAWFCTGGVTINVQQSACDSSDETLCEQHPNNLKITYGNKNDWGVPNGGCGFFGACVQDLASKVVVAGGTQC